jgi:hypothetical protein
MANLRALRFAKASDAAPIWQRHAKRFESRAGKRWLAPPQSKALRAKQIGS